MGSVDLDETQDRAQTQDERDLAAVEAEWKLSEDAYAEQRKNEQADELFESGEHWTEAELEWKKDHAKPAFVMDQTSSQIDKVNNGPVHQIIVKPSGGGADPKSASYWQGYCRRVENLSGAEDIYKLARRRLLVAGRAFWRIRADYFGQMELREDGVYDVSVFQQDLRLEPFLNQFSVYPDPRCRTLDFRDMRFCIITDDVDWKDVKAQLGKDHDWADLKAFKDTLGRDVDVPPTWANEQTLRIAERYYIEDQQVTLVVVQGPPVAPGQPPERKAVDKTKLPAMAGWVAVQGPDGKPLEHTFTIPKVKWMKFVWGRVLQRADVPGRYIPVVQVVASRRRLKGKDDFRGLVRGAKWPQRLVNFMESRLAETVDLAAYDTWKAAAEAVVGHTDAYTNAHRDRPGLLLWNHKDDSGEPIPEPQHVTVAPEIQGIAISAQRAGMSLRAVLGVPDVTPEELKPEQSGIAIRRRREEQSLTTNHYAEAIKSGVQHTGRILVSMGREILDMPRVLRITGDLDKEIEVVAYDGRRFEDDAKRLQAQGGVDAKTQQQIRHMLDVSVGDYDITVQAGKGFASGREETVDVIERVLPVLPPPAQMKAVPILVKNLDAPGMLELASRLEPEEGAESVPIEEAQKAQQVIDQLTQTVEDLQQQVEAKALEAQSRERIASQDNQTKLQIEQLKLEHEFRLEQLRIQADLEKAELAAKAQVAEAAMRPDPPMHEGGVS